MLLLVLNIHYSRASDIVIPDSSSPRWPGLPITAYRETASATGAAASPLRPAAPSSPATPSSATAASRSPTSRMPVSTRSRNCRRKRAVFLLAGRHWETELLSDTAWSLFGDTAPGWARVQAVCDFVHGHIAFGYRSTPRPTKTAFEAYQAGKGAPRLCVAITLCRCLNIPARYCTGYLGDIGVPPPHGPDGLCGLVRGLSRRTLVHVRSAQQVPRIGRVLAGAWKCHRRRPGDLLRPQHLVGFKVWTDEIEDAPPFRATIRRRLRCSRSKGLIRPSRWHESRPFRMLGVDEAAPSRSRARRRSPRTWLPRPGSQARPRPDRRSTAPAPRGLRSALRS